MEGFHGFNNRISTKLAPMGTRGGIDPYHHLAVHKRRQMRQHVGRELRFMSVEEEVVAFEECD